MPKSHELAHIVPGRPTYGLARRGMNGCVQLFIKPPHDKTNKMACAPSEDSDQPGQMTRLI